MNAHSEPVNDQSPEAVNTTLRSVVQRLGMRIAQLEITNAELEATIQQVVASHATETTGHPHRHEGSGSGIDPTRD